MKVGENEEYEMENQRDEGSTRVLHQINNTEIPKFCKNSCNNCTEKPKYLIKDLEYLTQPKIQNELRTHSHPSNRIKSKSKKQQTKKQVFSQLKIVFEKVQAKISSSL